MKRRDAIKLGAAAVAAATLPDCGLPRMLSELRGDDGAAAFNRMLDQQLATLSQPGFLHEIVGTHLGRTLTMDECTQIADKDVAFRRMLGTLLVTQGFRELPPETQLHPAVQQRMAAHAERLASTVFEVSDTLATLTPDERANVQRTLREQPDFGMEIGEHIDRRAATAGISVTRRLQFRRMMANTTFRIKHSDPGALIDENVAKVERLRAADGNDAALLALSKRLGERSFWQYEHLLARDDGPAALPPTAAPPPTPTPAPQPSGASLPCDSSPPCGEPPPDGGPLMVAPQPAAARPSPTPPHESHGVKAGLIVLGIGVLAIGAGFLVGLVGASDGAWTAGAILILLGLIVAIIGAIITIVEAAIHRG